MTARVPVCPVDDLPPGERVIVDHDDRSIGVFNVDGEYYAMLNECAHLGGPACEGKLEHAIEATYPGPGLRVRERYTDTPTVACPWHGWEYALPTGAHLGSSDIALPTFEVEVADGQVHVLVDGSPPDD